MGTLALLGPGRLGADARLGLTRSHRDGDAASDLRPAPAPPREPAGLA
jgi:hypothetical protein